MSLGKEFHMLDDIDPIETPHCVSDTDRQMCRFD